MLDRNSDVLWSVFWICFISESEHRSRVNALPVDDQCD